MNPGRLRIHFMRNLLFCFLYILLTFNSSKIYIQEVKNMNKRNGGPRYIFRSHITKKDGTNVYAKDYGYKAFKIPVFDKKK